MPFCPSCGKEYIAGEVCPNCGKPVSSVVGPPPVPSPTAGAPPTWNPPQDAAPSKVSRPTGVTILGILQILGSVVMLLAGLGVATFGGFGVAIFVFGILSLIFALALFSGRNWARILMLIGAALDIISIVGIIWGIILLWYLTRPHVVAYFKQPK